MKVKSYAWGNMQKEYAFACLKDKYSYIVIKIPVFLSLLTHEMLMQAVERAAGMDGQKITYSLIKHRLGDLFYRLV